MNARTTSRKDTVIKTILTISLIIALLIITGQAFYHIRKMKEKNQTIAQFAQAVESVTGELKGVHKALALYEPSSIDEIKTYSSDVSTELISDCSDLQRDVIRLRNQRNLYKDSTESLNQLLRLSAKEFGDLANTNTQLLQEHDSLQVIIDGLPINIKPLEPAVVSYEIEKDGAIIQISSTDPNVIINDWVIDVNDLGAKIHKVKKGGKLDGIIKFKGKKAEYILQFTNEHIINKDGFPINPIGTMFTIPSQDAFVKIFPNKKNGLVDKTTFVENIEFFIGYGIYGGKSYLPQDYNNIWNAQRGNISRAYQSFDKLRFGHGTMIGVKIIGFKPFMKN